jgi:ankyrin repeat protein
MAGQEAIVTFFLTCQIVDVISKDSIGHTALSYAVMNGHENIARRLLRNEDVQVNSQDTIHGRTPLIFALEYKYYALAKLLLSRSDVDISICTKRGRTALDYAADARMQEEAQEISDLIKAKVDDSTSDLELSCDDGWEIE